MIPNPTIEFELGGQPVIFNQESKVLIMNIHEPFYKAGKILSWDSSLGSPGFGINSDILKFIGERNLRLLIRCNNAPEKEYWANADILFSFIKSNNTEYLTSGIWLRLFPWKIFHSKPVFAIAL